MKFRFIGKHSNREGKELLGFSGTGFEFVLLPKKEKCSFVLSLASHVTEGDYQYINIYINGCLHSKEKLSNGSLKILVELENPEPKVLVKVIKLNEVQIASLLLEDVSLQNAEFGEIEPSNKKLIKFFGDSLTCGFGLLDYHGEVFHTETEDFTKAFPYLTASLLDMDYCVVARSGIGLGVRLYSDKVFEEIYDTVDMVHPCPDVRPANYAVISLGTNDKNDYLLLKEDERPQRLLAFKEVYLSLCRRVLKDNPDAKLFLIIKMVEWPEELLNVVKDVQKILVKEYENHCEVVEFIPNADGACNHPYFTAHEKDALLLVEAIKHS